MLMLTFLGTSGETIGASRRAPCAALLRGKDVWLFDAGEDTQRVLFEVEHMRPSKVSRRQACCALGCADGRPTAAPCAYI